MRLNLQVERGSIDIVQDLGSASGLSKTTGDLDVMKQICHTDYIEPFALSLHGYNTCINYFHDHDELSGCGKAPVNKELFLTAEGYQRMPPPVGCALTWETWLPITVTRYDNNYRTIDAS